MMRLLSSETRIDTEKTIFTDLNVTDHIHGGDDKAIPISFAAVIGPTPADPTAGGHYYVNFRLYINHQCETDTQFAIDLYWQNTQGLHVNVGALHGTNRGDYVDISVCISKTGTNTYNLAGGMTADFHSGDPLSVNETVEMEFPNGTDADPFLRVYVSRGDTFVNQETMVSFRTADMTYGPAGLVITEG